MIRCVCPLDHDLDEATCSICDLPIDRDLEPCDACGARVAGLVREEVEGVVCERCPTCVAEGAVP